MKLQFLLFVALLPFYYVSQTTVSIQIHDVRGANMRGVRTEVYCASNGVREAKTTDSQGKVAYSLTEKGVYEFNYLTEKPAFTFEVRGAGGEIGRSITYDPKGIYKTPKKIDRSKIAFKEVDQSNVKFMKKSGICGFTLILEDKSHSAVDNTDVAIVDPIGKTIYASKTGSDGKALFVLPTHRDFEIDVDGFKGFSYVKLKNSNGNWFEYTVSYEKTIVNQEIRNDTIRQKNITQTTGTSTHAYFEVFVVDYEGGPLKNEPVYLKQLNSENVFESTTDKEGRVEYLLPNGHEYLVNLKHENNVRLIDLSDTEGYRKMRLSVRYRGSVIIEEMLARREKERLEQIEFLAKQAEQQKEYEKNRLEYEKKMENVFTTQFETSPVISAPAPNNYLVRNSTGYNFKFNNQGPVTTPTLVGDKLFVSPGYYCPKYYCFNAKTGAFVWGVSLAESGPSPAIYSNGILLINTESCTLYALDANTGKLLWSKWLSSYIYTSPTVLEDKVYVTYQDHGFVLACFNLKTGDIVWQKRLRGDAITCPVVYKKTIHIATKEGQYGIYDSETGELKKQEYFKSLSSPTIVDNKIYITVAIGGEEKLAVYNATSLKLMEAYDMTATQDGFNRPAGLFSGMNFQGSRTIYYKGKCVFLDGENLYCFDPEAEKYLWKVNVGETANTQLPVIIDNKIYVGNRSGNILEISFLNGRISKTHRTGGALATHPVFKDGMMYAGSQKESMRAIRVATKKEFTQWGGSVGHNMVFE